MPLKHDMPSGSETELRRQLKAFLVRARENEAKMRVIRDFELRLMGAESLTALLRMLLVEYRETFSHDLVALTLEDPDHEVRQALEEDDPAGHGAPAQLRLLVEAGACARLAGLAPAPALGVYREDEHGWLFAVPPPADIRSLALMPLARHGRVMGAFTLASRDPNRFAGGVATDFLDHLAAVVGVCLESTLNLRRLRNDGLTDALTGVRNRRFLDERLPVEIARAWRQGRPLSLVLVDIDHFKTVNDTHGHPAGDAVLCGVAGRMDEVLRMSDILGRYGGEEFAIVLPETDVIEARRVAERIRVAVADSPFALAGAEPLPVTVSVGVSTLETSDADGDPGTCARALTERADRALYNSKAAGRNRVSCERDTSPAGRVPSP